MSQGTSHTHSPLVPTVQGHPDGHVVCVTCHTSCQNNDALRKHGRTEDHHPFGCLCGQTFARSDVLERHMACKNKIAKALCPLCCSPSPKAFARADHLHQHLRTFHKIPAGKVPEDFIPDGRDASVAAAVDQVPSFPCLVPGCTKTGELAYLRQIDLDEHVMLKHHASHDYVSVQPGFVNTASARVSGHFQPTWSYDPGQTFQQNAHQNNFSSTREDPQVDSRFVEPTMFAGHNEFQFDHQLNFEFGLDWIGLSLDA